MPLISRLRPCSACCAPSRHLQAHLSSSHLAAAANSSHGRSCPQRCVQARGAAFDVPFILSPEVVKPVFTAFNTLLLIPWFAMIGLPNTDFSKAMIKSNVPLTIFCALFCYMFVAATVQSAAQGSDLTAEINFLFFEAVADPDKMAEMNSRPSYAAQDWVHLCTWDYFVGQWIYLRGLDKRIFTRISLLATFSFGPWGLVSHTLTEAATLKLRGETPEDELKAKIAETQRIAKESEAAAIAAKDKAVSAAKGDQKEE